MAKHCPNIVATPPTTTRRKKSRGSLEGTKASAAAYRRMLGDEPSGEYYWQTNAVRIPIAIAIN
jgi:hypothetical protein